MLKNLRSKSAVILHESNVLLLTGRTPSNAILECFKVAVDKTLQKTAGLYACLFMIYVTRNDWKKYQNIKFRQFPTKLSQGWKQQKHTPCNNCNDSYISTFVLLSRLAFQFVHFNFPCHAKGEGKKRCPLRDKTVSTLVRATRDVTFCRPGWFPLQQRPVHHNETRGSWLSVVSTALTLPTNMVFSSK